MQERISGILCDLINIDTISSKSNLAIVDYILGKLGGIASRIETIPNAEGNKASVLAGFGNADRPGIVLSGHTDVVPVDGQDWSTPPFRADIRNGRIYGRGATDMKGFIAVVLAHAEEFARSATALPIHIALSYDEELGCKGAPPLVERVAGLAESQKLCIVGEPTGMALVRAHKGKISRRVEVLGKGGHSSTPHLGANAAVAAARIAVALADIARDLESATSAEPFDPPWSTLHVGLLRGGTALNLIPDRAEILFEIRHPPDAAIGDVLARIDAAIDPIRRELRDGMPEADIRMETIAAYPGLAMSVRDPAMEIALALSGHSGPPGITSFGTEAGLFHAAGIPTIVCGPGNVDRAHKADEWIGLDELAGASAMMRRIAAFASRG